MRAIAGLAVGAFVAACGGAAAGSASASMTVTDAETRMAPMEPVPMCIKGHHHPGAAADPSKLFVEITADDGTHANVLRQSATTGLHDVPYAVSVADGGDVELHVEVASLAPARDTIACKVKIFVLRLPQHDLLGIADGGARASGVSQAETCLSTIGTAIVREKIPVLLERQLEAKR